METYFSMLEVSRTCKTSRASLYRAIAKGELHITKFGRATRIAEGDLNRWLASLPRVTGRETD